jgi:hypothetical protein
MRYRCVRILALDGVEHPCGSRTGRGDDSGADCQPSPEQSSEKDAEGARNAVPDGCLPDGGEAVTCVPHTTSH